MVMQLLDHMKLIQSHISTLKYYLSCLRGRKVNLDFLNTFQIPSFSLWLVSTDKTLQEQCKPIPGFMKAYPPRESKGLFPPWSHRTRLMFTGNIHTICWPMSNILIKLLRNQIEDKKLKMPVYFRIGAFKTIHWLLLSWSRKAGRTKKEFYWMLSGFIISYRWHSC